MRTTLYEPAMPAGVEDRGDMTWHAPDVLRAAGPARWRSQFFTDKQAGRTGRRRATRYERFTTRMVLVSSVIMLGVTASLHAFNYGLETKTSSTSGTHGSFYKAED